MSYSEWEYVEFQKLLSIPTKNGLSKPKRVRGNGVKFINMGELFTYDRIYDIETERVPVTENELEGARVKKGDLLFARQSLVRSGAGKCSIVMEVNEDTVFESHLIRARINKELGNEMFYYYYFTSEIGKRLMSTIVNQVAAAGIRGSDLKKLKVPKPILNEQEYIVKMISPIDRKIEVNNQINKTLESMAQAIFKQWFVDFEFPNEDGKPYKSSGGDMVESELGMIPKGWKVGTLKEFLDIIDNRGKTPHQEPKKTEYPIIDVKALSGESRIINYENCMKFVNKETYETWFRSGHPSEGDILLSTVGSLAEMKMFIGNIGCIAQNVVALRCKSISNMYMYQYLKYIKNDLMSYNIGSVQPSIKVTHIIKHKILKPSSQILDKFHELAEKLSVLIYNQHLENTKLKDIRDTLLPKLMSGEIRVPLKKEGEQ